MASVVYNIAKANWMKADMDMDAASNVRARLCMSNTTAHTDIDADTVGNITTLDESDDSSYAVQTLASPTVTVDDTGDTGTFTSTSPITFTLSGNGTRDYRGMLLVDFVDGTGNDIPIAFIEFSGQPFPKEATSIAVNIPGNGWVQIQ